MSISILPVLSKMTCKREGYPTVVVDMLYDFKDPIRLAIEVSQHLDVTCLVPHLHCNAKSSSTKLWIEATNHHELRFCSMTGLREACYHQIGSLEYVTLQEMQWPVWFHAGTPHTEHLSKEPAEDTHLLEIRRNGERQGSLIIKHIAGVGIKVYLLERGIKRKVGEFVFDGLDYEYTVR